MTIDPFDMASEVDPKTWYVTPPPPPDEIPEDVIWPVGYRKIMMQLKAKKAEQERLAQLSVITTSEKQQVF